MDGFLRVDNVHLPSSPTNSFLADEVASICPLITPGPSPPTNDLINPLPEPEPDFSIGLVLANKLQGVKADGNSDEDKAESASSNSSVLAEPACAQLLNHRNVYSHMVKDEEKEAEESLGKSQNLQLTFRNPPDNYFFMSWNWPVIRKVSGWLFLSGIVAMVALVIGMIYQLPKTCNPPTAWYQGNLLYEIFPASFYNGKQNMEGDFGGIGVKSDYLMKLGVRGIRLNSIFHNPNYPNDFDNVSSLTEVAPVLGSLHEFNMMVNQLNSRNISVILDLPLYPYVKRLVHKKVQRNESIPGSTMEFLRSERSQELDIIEEAILHWISNGVDGFYLKGLENLQDDPNLVESLQRWKRILGENRILIVSEKFISSSKPAGLNLILNNVDLVDVQLDLSNGVHSVSNQIRSLQNNTLFSKPGMPWIQWCLGNVNSKRLSSLLPFNNGTLGATLLQLMLPGTPSIFYGDEIGLPGISDPKGERSDIKHLHQLTMMPWQNEDIKILPWIHGDSKVTGRYDQIDLISQMIRLRKESPSIYMNSVYKEGVTKPNIELKYAENQVIVAQRWYPRRKAYVLASNLGRQHITMDLSKLLYSGDVILGPEPDSKLGTILFKDISLSPGESVIAVVF